MVVSSPLQRPVSCIVANFGWVQIAVRPGCRSDTWSCEMRCVFLPRCSGDCLLSWRRAADARHVVSRAWSYMSLDACPERQPAAAFSIPLSVGSGITKFHYKVHAHLRLLPVIDVETRVDESRVEFPASGVSDLPVFSPPAVAHEHAVAGVVVVLRGVQAPPSPQVASPEWAALWQILGPILQHQAGIQQQLYNVWDHLGSNSSMLVLHGRLQRASEFSLSAALL